MSITNDHFAAELGRLIENKKKSVFIILINKGSRYRYHLSNSNTSLRGGPKSFRGKKLRDDFENFKIYR